MAGVGKRTYLREVNPYLICPLCRGYLIDATTVVECLHSFCRSCILKHLSTEAHCPCCKHVLNKAKPNIKADKALQDIVYKLVPGLYHKEMRRRREFYKKHPDQADSATPEQRGEDVSGRLIFAPEDAVSLSLEYLPPGTDPLTILLSTNDADPSHANSNNHAKNNNSNPNASGNRRYLQCPALVTIAHLKKFLALKYSVDMTRYTIEICHRRAPLPEHWTLMDVAYIYAWKRNAPIRFFYRVAQEEQRLEAPPHERPSTPGLGASLPPIDTSTHLTSNDIIDCTNAINKSDTQLCNSNGELSSPLKPENDTPKDAVRPSVDYKQIITEEKVSPKSRPLGFSPSSITVAAVTASTIATTGINSALSSSVGVTSTMTATTMTSIDTTKQIKTPIKILKNPDGRYEVLKSPPTTWPSKDQSPMTVDTKSSSSPEFSVVSIGDGQNSNGVKITLKQCSPGSTASKKPKVVSNVLLRCGQVEKDTSSTLLIQQLQRDRERAQATDKQEKQKRRVTFMERPVAAKIVNNIPKSTMKKPGEQQHDKKQFLQGFQLAARESSADYTIPDSSSKLVTAHVNIGENLHLVQSKNVVPIKKECEGANKNSPHKADEATKFLSASGAGAGNTSNKVEITNAVNSHGNGTRQFGSNTEGRMIDASSNTNIKCAPNTSNNLCMTPDVYTFANDPPAVPAGAVKRKCPPGLRIFEVKRKRQQNTSQVGKKQVSSTPNTPKSQARKCATEPMMSGKRAMNLTGESGSRTTLVNNIKPAPSPILSNDTRNLLDGCGLNIPASLSITLTAPKSPSNNSTTVESNDSKDNRKGALGKVSPSITLNDRSVDPRVLKALKAGQIRMPAPPKPKQTKQVNREIQNSPRQAPVGKRKREQDARDILDLSGGKKLEIHPLRIPQPVAKHKAKTPSRDSVAGMADQGQVVTLMSGHRYYRAPPGSLTPAAHRVTDCPLPTPSRTPVYAPSGLSSTLNSNRGNNLSSVFPSLQSLYALSQSPNLQQFQMDARLRLPRSDSIPSSIANNEGNNVTSNMPGKSHLAAQCAPVKPARSSVASLAVPISKQSVERPPLNRSLPIETTKATTFHSNDVHDSSDANQRLSVQTKYSPIVDYNSRFSPRSNSGSNAHNIVNKREEKVPGEPLRNSNTETNDNKAKQSSESLKKEQRQEQQEEQQQQQPQQQRQQDHREAASPRVSSTASPSPPPGHLSNIHNEENPDSHTATSIKNSSKGTTNAVSANVNVSKCDTNSEVTSSKSPASPDSSSITIESPTSKNSAITDSQATHASDREKQSDCLSKSNSDFSDNILHGCKTKIVLPKLADTKQLTSEMLQKQLLAAFPTNEWANNPIAAEHLGNFLKSLNASMKVTGDAEDAKSTKTEEPVCSDIAQNDNDVLSKSQKEAIE